MYMMIDNKFCNCKCLNIFLTLCHIVNWLFMNALILFYFVGGNVFPNLEKKRLEDLAYLMKGNYNHLPPDIPTTVRIYLAGTKQGITGILPNLVYTLL